MDTSENITPYSVCELFADASVNIPRLKKYLEEGGDINILDTDPRVNLPLSEKYGNSLLYRACDNSELELVKFLLENGIDVDIPNCSGLTPLHIACTHSDCEIIKCLIHYGADIEASDELEYTPLLFACSYGKLENAKALLEAGVNVSQVDADKNSCLHLAMESKNMEMIRVLLEHGADPNVQNMTGDTPFHQLFMVYHRRLSFICGDDGVVYRSLVDSYLEFGADVEIKNGGGFTVLDLCSRYSMPSLLDYIVQKKQELESFSIKEPSI